VLDCGRTDSTFSVREGCQTNTKTRFSLIMRHRNYCFHLWERNYRPTFFAAKNAESQAASLNRVKDILAEKVVDAKFGLGSDRSVKDFWKMCGIDLEKQSFKPGTCSLPESAFYSDAVDAVLAMLLKQAK
jgi:hypothetical protein